MFNNNEVSWSDKLQIKMRELDDALRQASDDAINRQVQKYMGHVRDNNRKIVELTQKIEEIESKTLREVSDEELKRL